MLQDAPGGALVERPKLGIPEDVAAGPLRDYLEWVHDLWKQAGEPSSHTMGSALKCSHTTVVRLFKGYPANPRRAYDLFRYLYGNPLRRVTRSDEDWDAFHTKAAELLDAADPARKQPSADEMAPGGASGRQAAAAGGLPGGPMSRRGTNNNRAFTICAAGNEPSVWHDYRPLTDLHQLVANGNFVEHDVREATRKTIPQMRAWNSQVGRLDVFFGFYHAFKDVYVDGRGYFVDPQRTQMKLNDFLPRFRKGVVLIDNVSARGLSMVEHLGPLLHDAVEEDGDRILMIFGRGRWPSVVDRLWRSFTTPRFGVGPVDGFEILARAAEELQESSDDFAVAQVGMYRASLPSGNLTFKPRPEPGSH